MCVFGFNGFAFILSSASSSSYIFTEFTPMECNRLVLGVVALFISRWVFLRFLLCVIQPMEIITYFMVNDDDDDEKRLHGFTYIHTYIWIFKLVLLMMPLRMTTFIKVRTK